MYVGVTEAKRRTEELVMAALAGEEVVLTKWGTPVAELRRATPSEAARAKREMTERGLV